MGLSEDQVEFYSTTSEMGKLGKSNREAFYNDVNLNGEKVDNKLSTSSLYKHIVSLSK